MAKYGIGDIFEHPSKTRYGIVTKVDSHNGLDIYSVDFNDAYGQTRSTMTDMDIQDLFDNYYYTYGPVKVKNAPISGGYPDGYLDIVESLSFNTDSITHPVKTYIDTCTCESRDLANFGCKCGYLTRLRAK